MSSYIFSLVTRAAIAISKEARVPAESEAYAQATQDAADILAHLCAYVEALEACVPPPKVAMIEAQVSANYPIKTLAQSLFPHLFDAQTKEQQP